MASPVSTWECLRDSNHGQAITSFRSAWAHYMLGRYQQAVVELERAVSLAPTDPVLNDHLGDAYWMVGRKEEARFQWTRALSFEPEPDLAPKLEQKLETGLGASGQLEPEAEKVKSQAGTADSGG